MWNFSLPIWIIYLYIYWFIYFIVMFGYPKWWLQININKYHFWNGWIVTGWYLKPAAVFVVYKYSYKLPKNKTKENHILNPHCSKAPSNQSFYKERIKKSRREKKKRKKRRKNLHRFNCFFPWRRRWCSYRYWQRFLRNTRWCSRTCCGSSFTPPHFPAVFDFSSFIISLSPIAQPLYRLN